MARYVKLYGHFLKLRIKVMMEYRTDFIIGILSIIFVQTTAVLFVKLVFDQIETLNGWNYYEVLFVFGISICGRFIHHTFFDNLWVIGMNYIKPGNFDRLLIRPINPLFHLVADRVQQDGIGQLIMGVLVLSVAMPHLPIDWGIGNIVLLVILVISSGIIYVAINLMFATLSFWMTDSLPIMWAMFNISDFVRYPITIYNKGIQAVLTWVIPYAFASFYPAEVFINHEGYRNVGLLTPIIAIVLSVLAYVFWGRGLKSFSSTGS